jgi:hypothetical protein
MARGWESKAIESQQADAAPAANPRRRLSAADLAAEARRRDLLLARARVSADLVAATRPAHRTMLEQALADLDRQLAEVAAGGAG